MVTLSKSTGSLRLAVRTSPSHGENRGSIPLGSAKKFKCTGPSKLIKNAISEKFGTYNIIGFTRCAHRKSSLGRDSSDRNSIFCMLYSGIIFRRRY